VKTRYRLGLAVLAVFAAGFLLPERALIPVQAADRSDWHPRSFWYEPWGRSGVHKGIDIFAREGVSVLAATPGIVIFEEQLPMGGNVVGVLGPRWRVHYYAHLRESNAGFLVGKGERIGSVGTTGNAAGKPPHLHYAVISLLPLPWRASGETQGWKKMFFLDPSRLLAGD
jgi:murein DD-endopeptidase MepM/ murein hydrolase activator NlpD